MLFRTLVGVLDEFVKVGVPGVSRLVVKVHAFGLRKLKNTKESSTSTTNNLNSGFMKSWQDIRKRNSF